MSKIENETQKTDECEDIKLMLNEIGEACGIEIQFTEGGSDFSFSYPKEDKEKLISILDRYLKNFSIED